MVKTEVGGTHLGLGIRVSSALSPNSRDGELSLHALGAFLGDGPWTYLETCLEGFPWTLLEENSHCCGVEWFS